MLMAMDEKRQFQRAEFNGEALVEHGKTSFRAMVRDLSVGGVYILASEKPPFGAMVKVTLQLPALAEKKRPSVLVGIVRWVRDDGFGVQFGPTGAADTYALAEYVARKTLQI